MTAETKPLNTLPNLPLPQRVGEGSELLLVSTPREILMVAGRRHCSIDTQDILNLGVWWSKTYEEHHPDFEGDDFKLSIKGDYHEITVGDEKVVLTQSDCEALLVWFEKAAQDLEFFAICGLIKSQA